VAENNACGPQKVAWGRAAPEADVPPWQGEVGAAQRWWRAGSRASCR